MPAERPLTRLLALIIVLAALLAVAAHAGHHPPALVGHGPTLPPDPWIAA